MAVAYGLFGVGLVLGWSGLFLRAATLPASLLSLAWFAGLGVAAAYSPDPRAAAAGAIAGALSHLLLQLGLEGDTHDA